MAITNFTGDAGQKSYVDLFCSIELAGEIRIRTMLISLGLGFFSITAFLGNALILVALHKESSLHAPSKLLLRNLATTDLCVGLIVEPVLITYFISVLNEQWHVCRFAFGMFHITVYILSSVSLFTLAAISVDRLLALLLGLRYRQVVTLKRIYMTIILSWILATIGSTIYFWNHVVTVWFGYSVTTLCQITSVFCYGRIFLVLRNNQVQPHSNNSQGQPSQTVPLNIARYKKTVFSALWVELALVVCYLPHEVVEILLLVRGLTPSVLEARSFSAILVLLNSSLNPFLYCWRIREVRQAVKDIFSELFCSSS